MIGKKIKVNDYKFTYGQETVHINVYGAFKNTKSGNKYAIYSYENNNNKLFYGSFFQRGKEAVIMTSKENPKEIVKEFVDSILNETKNEKFEIISLEDISTVQIIDEHQVDYQVDIPKLYDLTIPKPIVKEEKEPTKKKKSFSIAWFFFIVFLLVVIAFFIFNPEVIMGKNKVYSCTKSYIHKTLPSSVTEEISLTFNGKGLIEDIEITTDYSFNDTKYYNEFKDKSYFYQYMEEGDTYKFIDEDYTYRLFSKIDTTEEYFLPTEETELVSYYQDKDYTCKRVEVDEKEFLLTIWRR